MVISYRVKEEIPYRCNCNTGCRIKLIDLTEDGIKIGELEDVFIKYVE